MMITDMDNEREGERDRARNNFFTSLPSTI